MSSDEDIFEAVLSEFKARLTKKELEDFGFASLEGVQSEIARIQKEQEMLKNMMDTSRLKLFLDAMNQFGKVIEVFLDASKFVPFIWGPMKFLLQVANTWPESFDALLEAYRQIGEEIPLLHQHEAIFDYDPDMRKALADIYHDILEFHRRAIRSFSGRVWRQVFRSMWKDFDFRFKNILERLRCHRRLIESRAAVLHSQATLHHIRQYQHDRLELIHHIDRQEKDESRRKYLEAMEWIAGADSTIQDHDDCRSIRYDYPGSGDWILKHEKVQNWKEADTPVSSVLWLNGIPGAGKTILASTIIDDCMLDKSFYTAYFYCKDDPVKKTCIAIFKGLLNQLLSQCHDLVPYFHDRYLSSGEVTLTSQSLAKQLLELFCEYTSKQYIIIDGLDECDNAERRLVLLHLTKIVEHSDNREPGKLRILFVSQDFNDIDKALTTAAKVSLVPEDNQDDINKYVNEWVERIRQKHDLGNDHVEHIKASTCARAKGMFLFAKLVMENLFAQPTRGQLLEEIDLIRFPEGLEDAYKSIMRRIKRNAHPAEWKVAQKLLGWMVCVKRPLKWREIQGAFSIDTVDQTVNFGDRGLRFHIRDVCGSLIQLLRGDRVELVHSTAKIYIKNTEYVCEAAVECNLTALCLQYLTFECFEKDISEEKLYKFTFQGYFAFQDYAIAKWFHHFSAMVDTGQNLLSRNPDVLTALEEIKIVLDEFTGHYDEIFQEPVVGKSREACETFKNCGFYENLLHLWNHIYRHEQEGSEARNKVSIEALGDALDQNRKFIEKLTKLKLNSEQKRDLDSFYGENRYKCSKLTCYYFHEGFKDKTKRDRHLNRHDRPFHCAFPDCSLVDFGFASNRELESHARTFHPDKTDQENTFVTKKAPPAKTPFKCEICNKSFTRGFSHRNHVRSHTGERPFPCTECGRAFTRANDCKRHEKIHARR